jgi:hypothetical protein
MASLTNQRRNHGHDFSTLRQATTVPLVALNQTQERI